MIPETNHYYLRNAHIHQSLITQSIPVNHPDGFCLVDLEIKNGVIVNLISSNNVPVSLPNLDLKKKQIWPCLIDLHTHLDKGHIWERSPNPDGTFSQALTSVFQDTPNWSPEELYARMNFGLKCSYAHGTIAIRTHLDSFDQQAYLSFDILKQLQSEWQNKLIIQGVSLVSLDYYLTPAGEKLADLVADMNGVLGGVVYMNPEVDQQIDRLFSLATERQLNLDLHTDESQDPNDITLYKVAQTALKTNFTQNIVCGHCCSLAVQSSEQVAKTLDLVKQANISIVSLPLCNLYLQDRMVNRTPYWRGTTLIHEISSQGIPIAIASDNCRDPFYGFGDHDMLEVLSLSTKIAHLDRPYQNWPQLVTKTPAQIMGLPNYGQITIGSSADFIIFKGRYFSELFSRNQRDRLVVRSGKVIDSSLPDYEELDLYYSKT